MTTGATVGGHVAPRLRDAERAPSPPAYGALALLTLVVMATIILTYTLLEWDWQQRFGAWNYGAAAALIPLLTGMMYFWEPDRRL